MMNATSDDRTLVGCIAAAAISAAAGLWLWHQESAGAALFVAVLTIAVVAHAVYDAVKLMGRSLAELGFVLIWLAIYAAILWAIVWGFLHYPTPTAILVGAVIIARAVTNRGSSKEHV